MRKWHEWVDGELDVGGGWGGRRGRRGSSRVRVLGGMGTWQTSGLERESGEWEVVVNEKGIGGEYMRVRVCG